MAPCVSVLMPVCNAERHLAEAVESVLEQTFEDFEFLVLDDGSTDGSREIVRAYARRDARIRHVERTHAGFAQVLNDGLEQARGRYVARMDADDRSRRERLARQVRYLDAHPEAVAVGSDVLQIDPEGLPISVRHHERTHEDVQKALLSGVGAAFTHPAVTMRRRAARAAGGYDGSYRPVEDLDFFLRLCERGRFTNLPDVLLDYRLRHQSMSRAERAPLAENARRAIREAQERRGLPPRFSEAYARVAPERPLFFHLQWAWQALRNGFWATARKHLATALRLDPFFPLKIRLLARVVPPRNALRFLKRHVPFG